MPREDSLVCEFCGARDSAMLPVLEPGADLPVRPWFVVTCLTPLHPFEPQYYCTEEHHKRDANGEKRLPGAPERPVR